MICIATFFSHYDAMRCKKLCDGRGWAATLMPVPRTLSSSCGSCVRYEGDARFPTEDIPQGVEQIVQVAENGYAPLYRA